VVSAAKFVDFFVHDILDYTILSKKEDSFTKHLTVFDIREAIKEIIRMLENKVLVKGINVQTFFKGFDKDYDVKTD